MSRKGDKHFGEKIIQQVLKMKEEGITNKEIALHFGFEDMVVIKRLITRHNRRQRRISEGHVPKRKGRPRKLEAAADQGERIKQLERENELLKAFLSEHGRM